MPFRDQMFANFPGTHQKWLDESEGVSKVFFSGIKSAWMQGRPLGGTRKYQTPETR